MNTFVLDVIIYIVSWYLLVWKLGQTNFKKSVKLKKNKKNGTSSCGSSKIMIWTGKYKSGGHSHSQGW